MRVTYANERPGVEKRQRCRRRDVRSRLNRPFAADRLGLHRPGIRGRIRRIIRGRIRGGWSIPLSTASDLERSAWFTPARVNHRGANSKKQKMASASLITAEHPSPFQGQRCISACLSHSRRHLSSILGEWLLRWALHQCVSFPRDGSTSAGGNR